MSQSESQTDCSNSSFQEIPRSVEYCTSGQSRKTVKPVQPAGVKPEVQTKEAITHPIMFVKISQVLRGTECQQSLFFFVVLDAQFFAQMQV